MNLTTTLRSLRKAPRFSALAILLIALGTGGCAAVFSLFDSLLLQPRHGIADERTLVDIGRTQAGAGFDNFSYPDYEDYRSRNTTFVDIAAVDYSPNPAGLAIGRDAQNVHLQFVSANFFDVLGTAMRAGRPFSALERPEAGIVLSHDYWKKRFDGDASVIGEQVFLNNVPVFIAGVAEPGFRGTSILAADVWAPFDLIPVMNPGSTFLAARGNSSLMAIGRLKHDATIEQAQLDLAATAARLAREYPETHAQRGVAVVAASRFAGDLRRMATTFLGLLGALALLVMLVVSANIGGLMLARGATRQREFALRSALGADRRRLVRETLMEHLVLFAIGGAGGLLVCSWLLDAFRGVVPQLPVALELTVRMSPAAFGFTLGFAVLVGFVFSIGPALSSSRFDLLTVLRRGEQPKGGSRLFSLRGLFLLVQLTLSLALLITATGLTHSLWRLARADPGFDTRGVELASFDLTAAGLNAQSGMAFADELLRSARALPSVRHAALTVAIPLNGSGFGFGSLRVPGAATDAPSIGTDWNLVSPGYFATLDIPLLRGRDFTAVDRANAPLVAIVNETFARRVWPNADAIGQVLLNEDNRPLTVIAVARDAKYRSVQEAPRSHIYVPFAQNYFRRPTLLVKTRDEASVLPAIREIVQKLQPTLPIHHAQNLASAVAVALVPQRVAAGAALGTGLLGLLLSAVGVYGITLFWTTTRSREFGVRIALGATRSSVIRLALLGTLRLTLTSIAVGSLGALALTRIANSLFGGMHLDPALLGATATAFAAIVTFAAFLPARRAGADPAAALRAE